MIDPALLSHPTPLRVLIDEAIRTIRRNFRALYPGIAIPLALLSMPASFLYFERLAAFSSFATEEPDPADMLATFAGIGVAFSTLMAAHYAGWGASVLATVDAAAERPIAMKKSWLWMLRPRVIGTFALGTIAVLVGGILCVLPGMYLGLLFAFVGPVMVEEERYGISALKRSAELLHFRTRLSLGANPIVKIFVLLVVAYLLASAVSMLVQIPFALVQQIFLIREATAGEAPDPIALMQGMAWLQIPGALLGSLANAALYLYLNLGIALLYLDVRKRREGRDLEAALEELERSVAEAGAL